MPRKFPQGLLDVEFLPGIRVGIVLGEGRPAITLIGTLIAEIEEQHRDAPVIHLPIKVDVNKEVELEPELLLVQLTTALTVTTLIPTVRTPVGSVIYPVGAIIAVNLDDILMIGPQ